MIRMLTLWVAVAAWLTAGCGGSATPSGGAATSAALPPGAIAVTVTEKGFEPAEITVTHGQEVTLVVTRKTTKTCATEFVMKSHGINQPLPLDQPVTIRFTPEAAGELRYACAMDMIAGKIVVR